MSKTTTTVTREYDEDGKPVRETTVTTVEDEAPRPVVVYQPYQVYPQPYQPWNQWYCTTTSTALQA